MADINKHANNVITIAHSTHEDEESIEIATRFDPALPAVTLTISPCPPLFT